MSILQPPDIAAMHDTILEHYITSEMKVLADGEILMLVGMHRSGYMFTFWQEQKAIPSLEGLRVMGTVDPHRVYKSQVALLINTKGVIQGISKECISCLRIDLEYIKKQ